VNWIHRRLCRSGEWRRTVETELLPWALRDVDLGERVLEIGPGPGLTTDALRERYPRLTAVEIDSRLASELRGRMKASNVEVVEGDGAAMPFASESFSGALCFTMLHHVPSAALQDHLFREAHRVLMPGGIFLGTDSRRGWFMSLIHIGDTMVLLDPQTLARRLETAGFEDVHVEVTPHRLRFQARRP
jgi:SAM-dependent methyltransferase